MSSSSNLPYSNDEALFADAQPQTDSPQGDALTFADHLAPQDSADADTANQGPWKIVIVDDEDMVHTVSKMVFQDLNFKDRPLQLISGYSGEDARRLLKEHPDAAVLLLDVVMETDNAGLDAVHYIRKELDNPYVRIIMRTGQPGHAPEQEIITNYDINDYREKSELTSQKLASAVLTALRSYDDLLKIHALATSNETLENLVQERTKALTEANANLKTEIQERMRTLEAFRKSEALLKEAQRIAKIGYFELNIQTMDMTWTDTLYAILGLPNWETQPTYPNFINTIHTGDQAHVKAAIEQCADALTDYEIEHRITLPDGDVKYVRQSGKAFLGGNVTIVRSTVQDITEQHTAQEEMKKLSSAVEQTADAIMITNTQGIIEYINPAFTSMTGYTREDAIGATPALLKSGKQSGQFYTRMWKAIQNGKAFMDVLINKRKDGTLYYEEKTITPQVDSYGNITHFISSGKDISERMEAQQRLLHLAHHDALTGMPNRILFLDRLGQALKRSGWRHRKIAVLFLDLDRFKVINDTLGHDIGDELLKQMSNRLHQCTREGDTVARLGGDEFAILLNDVASTTDIPGVADKILEALARPFELRGRELFVTTSIGVSIFPDDGRDSQTLLKKADVAMYHAKGLGRNNFQFYTHEDECKAVERLTLETGLRRALERDEFRLNYQPQVNLMSSEVEAMEGLLRWEHPHLGIISPGRFIPLLEETGMIIPVGDWVIKTACEQEKAREAAGLKPIRVAVNISIAQFRQRDFVSRVKAILDETGLEPDRLEFEITESVVIDNIHETATVLNQLHDLGVHLSIDDFGTGYSSMSYLRKLPFDTLKIDRSFIRYVSENSDDAAIASAIITLAHTMDLSVIAEGVETAEQLKFLCNQGCDIIQGFLCSPPLPIEALNQVVMDNDPAEFIKLLT